MAKGSRMARIGEVVAARLGPQLYCGLRPTPAHLEPVAQPPEDPHWPPGKPHGGLWTSTLRDGVTSAYVELAPPSERTGLGPFWRLDPEPDARVAVVHTVRHLALMINAFPRTHPSGHPEPDFVAIAAAGYAGVHLTARGVSEVGSYWPLGLYGWDCESTLWLGWAFVGEPQQLHRPA